MSHQVNGFVPIPAGVLVVACAAYLDARTKRIAADRERMVLARMAKVQRKWFRKPFHLTRDEAIAELQKCSDWDWVSPWKSIEYQGSILAEDIAELWHAAQTIGPVGDILVSSFNAAKLHPWIEAPTN